MSNYNLFLDIEHRDNGKDFYRILRHYINPYTKQEETTLIEELGYMEGFSDPIGTANKKIEKYERKGHFKVAIDPERRLDDGNKYSRNYGFVVFLMYYHELEIDSFIKEKAEAAGLSFDANAVIRNLVYNMLLCNESEDEWRLRAPWEKDTSPWKDGDRFFEEADYTIADVYAVYEFLAGCREELLKYLDEKVRTKLGFRQAPLNLHYCTNVYSYGTQSHKLGLIIDQNGLPVTFGSFDEKLQKRKTLQLLMEKLDGEWTVDETRGPYWRLEDRAFASWNHKDFTWTDERVSGFWTLCFIALLLMRILQYRLETTTPEKKDKRYWKFPTKKIVKALKDCYGIYIAQDVFMLAVQDLDSCLAIQKLGIPFPTKFFTWSSVQELIRANS